jgi:hypothetical protein
MYYDHLIDGGYTGPDLHVRTALTRVSRIPPGGGRAAPVPPPAYPRDDRGLWGAWEPVLSGDELLPAQLARAAATSLVVDGVGLSVHDVAGHSTPLDASDEAAGTARLQFTAGAGPCMFAAESGGPVFASHDQLRTRWPAFHDLLVTHTPFRSVVALPLPGDLRGHGAPDLYLTHPVGLITFDAMEALCVAEADLRRTQSRRILDGVDRAGGPTVDQHRNSRASGRGSGWPPEWSAWLCSSSPPTRWPCCAAPPTPPTAPLTRSPRKSSLVGSPPGSWVRTPPATTDQPPGTAGGRPHVRGPHDAATRHAHGGGQPGRGSPAPAVPRGGRRFGRGGDHRQE